MSIDIDNALVGRWNATSLNSSIATLDPGDDVPTPETAAVFPRANYYSPSDPVDGESRGTLTKRKQYTIESWGTTYELVGGYVKAIAAALLNSENSSTNALQVAQNIGKIMSTHEIDQTIEKHDDSVFCGRYMLEVRWEKRKTIP